MGTLEVAMARAAAAKSIRAETKLGLFAGAILLSMEIPIAC